jgi:mono/diheme cytochrome c family protein
MKNKFAGVGLVASLLFIATASLAAERDITIPRVPADQLEAAKAMKNPVPPTPENIAKGKELFEGKATCFTCHGMSGKGDGPAGQALDPSPRNFTNPEFHKLRTDGELFWVIKNGSAGTGMISYAPAIISDEEAWTIINYERTFGKK